MDDFSPQELESGEEFQSTLSSDNEQELDESELKNEEESGSKLLDDDDDDDYDDSLISGGKIEFGGFDETEFDANDFGDVTNNTDAFELSADMGAQTLSDFPSFNASFEEDADSEVAMPTQTSKSKKKESKSASTTSSVKISTKTATPVKSTSERSKAASKKTTTTDSNESSRPIVSVKTQSKTVAEPSPHDFEDGGFDDMDQFEGFSDTTAMPEPVIETVKKTKENTLPPRAITKTTKDSTKTSRKIGQTRESSEKVAKSSMSDASTTEFAFDDVATDDSPVGAASVNSFDDDDDDEEETVIKSKPQITKKVTKEKKKEDLVQDEKETEEEKGTSFKQETDLMSVEKVIKVLGEAIQKIKDQQSQINASNPTSYDEIAVSEAYGRYLSEDVESLVDLPPFNASIVDGYAIRSKAIQNVVTLKDKKKIVFQCIGEMLPGYETTKFHTTSFPNPDLVCVYITTGAEIPSGFKYVIPVEEVQVKDNTVEYVGTAERLQAKNYRSKGSDLQKGSVIIKTGQKIGASEIGILSSAGIQTVRCILQPNIALISNGSELKSPSDESAVNSLTSTTKQNWVFDSNLVMLQALLDECQINPVGSAIFKDDPKFLESWIDKCMRRNNLDLIISTGAVSKGSADHIRQILEKKGEILASWLDLKPGKPTLIVLLSREKAGFAPLLFMGLPGNPVSAFVTYHMFVYPVIQALQSASKQVSLQQEMRPSVEVTLLENCEADATRRELKRGQVYATSSGLCASVTANQLSCHLLNTLNVNCLLDVPSKKETSKGIYEAGEKLKVFLIGPIMNGTPNFEEKMLEFNAQTVLSTSKKSRETVEAVTDSKVKDPIEKGSKSSTHVATVSTPTHTPSVTFDASSCYLHMIVISDTCSETPTKDEVIPTLKSVIKNSNLNLCKHMKPQILPDDISMIQSRIQKVLNEKTRHHLVILSGGTGLSSRDKTPEAIDGLLTKRLPGLEQLMYTAGLQSTPHAALSRLRAGINGKCFILALPGSPKAVQECLEVALPILPHAMSLL